MWLYLVKFPMAGGESVVVEMGDEQLAEFAPAAVEPGEVAATAAESFESAVDRLLPAGARDRRADEAAGAGGGDVGVGVKLTAKAGVIVAKAAGEANFTVTVKWRGRSG
jgi:hypothetical protein